MPVRQSWVAAIATGAFVFGVCLGVIFFSLVYQHQHHKLHQHHMQSRSDLNLDNYHTAWTNTQQQQQQQQRGSQRQSGRNNHPPPLGPEASTVAAADLEVTWPDAAASAVNRRPSPARRRSGKRTRTKHPNAAVPPARTSKVTHHRDANDHANNNNNSSNNNDATKVNSNTHSFPFWHTALSKKERHERLRELQARVLQRLHDTQFGDSSNIMVCEMMAGCGFGCLMHRVAVCLNRALETNRTMYMPRMIGTYRTDGPDCSGWDCLFEPVRRPITLHQSKDDLAMQRVRRSADDRSLGPSMHGINSTVATFRLSPVLSSKEAFDHPLPAFIRDEVEALFLRKRDARLWYVGQLIGWLMRPNARMKAILQRKLADLQLSLPVDFAVHIRMTDKLKKEAKLHCWREYFLHVDHFLFSDSQYWHTMHSYTPNTTAFVATDDPSIFAEGDRNSLSTWRHNRIVWNPEGASLATKMSTRVSLESLENLLCEIYIMASARFLVGTFSSQVVSRVVAELKMFNGDFDVLERTASLDDQWYGVI
ncbi:hypothetical protein PTSG_00782 [Salpingoeca rosetta]|uniref:GT23 domain-containing protein n=1 Tax=Salpingoeca rosetta (strain ATCC 50818 / BSB-021) TaxID=946362 RepID=F2TXG6_SALR5|nr:uncharacterized protein PTSG_00782 [Salpingoeca rosetta]EGD76075.1 hypothetical protein PTSG_00782 [Salpingoeca rosetta]|eukprot:XP_004998250.1 hypothetical protein PTSG_00782 [Salpingoeca rosetta]